MPADPVKVRESYIKKAQAIMRLSPDKQQKAIKKLRKGLEAKDSHLGKLETEIALYKSKDEKGLIAYIKALQKKAEAEGRGEKISNFRVPIKRSEYLKNKAKYDAIPWEDRPLVLPTGKTIAQWWKGETEGLEKRYSNEKANYDNLYDDNKTLLGLRIGDLEQQKTIIEPLKFEDMERHFGSKLVLKLTDKEIKEIDREVKKQKPGIEKTIKKSISDLLKKLPKEKKATRIKSDVDNKLNEIRSNMMGDTLVKKNKARFKEIRGNQLHSIDYRLGELQAEYRKLKGSEHEKKTD